MEAVLIVTISGPDRAGLVEQLAAQVTAHGGNWEHSRMTHLADRFVGLLQITVPSKQRQDLESAIYAIPEFEDHPYVINGFSELFSEVFGKEYGIGVRSAVGMHLPKNIAVEIEAVFLLET